MSEQPAISRDLTQEALLVRAPRDYFIAPVFAATPQKKSREVLVGDRLYQIGGFHPMRRDASPPALDVRHARAIFSLLSFRDPYDSGTRLIRFSFNEFCRRYANSNGGRYARAIAQIVGDLLDTYIKITDTRTGVGHTYRLIERIDIESRPPRRKDSNLARSRQTEMWFNGCELSPEFCGILNQIVELHYLKLDVFTAIRSDLARAIYLYIPSRAFHHTEDKPFEINLTTLLQQVDFPVPATRKLRKKLFTQNKNSILQQLDGLETLSGVFRVKLAETADKEDWKLQAWVKKDTSPKLAPPPPQEDSKLLKAFLKSGRTREDWKVVRSRVSPLSGYEMDLLEAAKVDFQKSQRFLEMAKAILGESHFDSLLAEAKGDHLEGRKAKKNPTARLIFRLIEAISIPRQTGANRESNVWTTKYPAP